MSNIRLQGILEEHRMSGGLTRNLKPAGTVMAAVVLGFAAYSFTPSSETLLRSSFARALGPVPGAMADQAPLAKANAAGAPVAGTEEFWLSAVGDPLVTKSVSLGDAITLTLDGAVRNYRVTAVSEIAPPQTTIDTKAQSDRLLLVTAGDPADPLARQIRFVLPRDDLSAKSQTGARQL